METKAITTINDVQITIYNGNDQLVPIKPICEALGIAYQSQHKKIKEDEILSSVITLRVTTGSDGKEYEMSCLPIEFIFGWLFTINPSNVNESARDNVSKYKLECYKALFKYFIAPKTFLQEKQILMEKQIKRYQECQRNFKDAQKLMNEAKTCLNQVVAYTIDEWEGNNRQLVIDFSEE